MMEIPNDLKGEIWDFCRANNITNIDEFTLKLLKQGFTSEKFGSTPMIKTIEKEVEKIVEVQVEKIVEKIVANNPILIEFPKAVQTSGAPHGFFQLSKVKPFHTKLDFPESLKEKTKV